MGDKFREVRGGRVGERERVREIGEGVGVVEGGLRLRDRGMGGGVVENRIGVHVLSMHESHGTGSAQRTE